MEVQFNQRYGREDSVAASTKQRKSYKQNRKIKKNHKNRAKNVHETHIKKINLKYSPDYTESSQTQYNRLYYSDEHKPLITDSKKQKQKSSINGMDEQYQCFINTESFRKLREQVLQQREVILKLAEINL